MILKNLTSKVNKFPLTHSRLCSQRGDVLLWGYRECSYPKCNTNTKSQRNLSRRSCVIVRN